MSLHCLIYTSVATRKMTDDDLKAILNKARPHNYLLEITGMLLYLDPYFVQVLEGEEDLVDKKFRRIATDPRHHKISLIYKQAIGERSFYNFTMGFNKIDSEYLESAQSLEQIYNGNSFHEHPNHIVELLEMFKSETLF